MVLYNVLIPKRVDDCIRVLVHHEQAAQSTNVLDIDLGRKKVHRADSILPRDSVILNPNIYTPLLNKIEIGYCIRRLIKVKSYY